MFYSFMTLVKINDTKIALFWKENFSHGLDNYFSKNVWI